MISDVHGDFAALQQALAQLDRLGVDHVVEVLEDRHGNSSTVITSQLDENWHPVIGDDTIADAVCDRLVHNTHKVKLAGESIRKTKADLTKGQKPAK